MKMKHRIILEGFEDFETWLSRFYSIDE